MMQEEATYGSQFIKHLQLLSKQTPFNYSDLQQVKLMSQQQLAERIQADCDEAAKLILNNSANVAAELIHSKRCEAQEAGAAKIQTAGSLLEVIIYTFSFFH